MELCKHYHPFRTVWHQLLFSTVSYIFSLSSPRSLKSTFCFNTFLVLRCLYSRILSLQPYMHGLFPLSLMLSKLICLNTVSGPCAFYGWILFPCRNLTLFIHSLVVDACVAAWLFMNHHKLVCGYVSLSHECGIRGHTSALQSTPSGPLRWFPQQLSCVAFSLEVSEGSNTCYWAPFWIIVAILKGVKCHFKAQLSVNKKTGETF